MTEESGFEGKYRWGLILAAFIIMMIISIYQYSWFLFAYAIREQFGWDLATLGLTFTIFTYTATFIQPLSGYIADSYGPRKIAVASSFLTGVGLILASFTSSPKLFYLMVWGALLLVCYMVFPQPAPSNGFRIREVLQPVWWCLVLEPAPPCSTSLFRVCLKSGGFGQHFSAWGFR